MGNLGSSKYMSPVHELRKLLSENPNENPDFYNWNRVHVAYCAGSSYTSDANEVDPATNLTYSGAKVFYALMEEFKAKGMGMAKNAIFAGNSAGGVAVMLHYDRFGALFPNTTRVKCLANSSYFIDVQKLDGDKLFQFYEFLVGSVGSAKWIPQQCTSRMKPSLCFFPQNSLQYVNTPIFLTMSSFDQTQLKYGLSMSHEVCVINNNCTLNEIRRVKELRLDFLSLLPKTKSHSSIAIWVNNCTSHEFTYFSWYGSQKLKVIGNKTYGEVFVDWYFDQNAISPIQIIDKSDKPVDCSAFGQRP